MIFRSLACVAIAALFLAASNASAQSAPGVSAQTKPTPEQQAEIDRLNGILKSEHPIFGDVNLPEARTTLHLGKAYYFLGKDDARRAIVEGWKNPANAADGVLGLIIPAGKVFANSWGAVVTYEPSGYVADTDAEKANYDELITKAHDAEPQINEQRSKDGFAPIHLVGWAQPPSYNKQMHYLIWARDIKFGGSPNDTLNYDVRMLGRGGVLSVNVIAGMDELPQIRTDADALARQISFNPGATYGEFDSAHDKKAAYGVAGLVAAGMGLVLAQKFGMVALVLLFFKKGIVVALAAVAGLGRWFSSRFGGRKKVKPATTVLGQASASSNNFLIDEGPSPKVDDPIAK